MKRGIMCGLRFYSPPCNNQSVNSPYPGIILWCTMLIQEKEQTPRLLLLMIPRTTLVCGDKMITFFQTASSLCLSLAVVSHCLSTCYVSPRWSRSSKCSDRSFPADRAGRPALRQQELFDARFPLESGIWALLIRHYTTSLCLCTPSFTCWTVCDHMHSLQHVHRHASPLRHSALSHRAMYVSLAFGLKSFISLSVALISILEGTN